MQTNQTNRVYKSLPLAGRPPGDGDTRPPRMTDTEHVCGVAGEGAARADPPTPSFQVERETTGVGGGGH